MTTSSVRARRWLPPRPRAGWLGRLGPRGGAALFLAELVALLVLWQVLVGGLRIINPVFLPPPLDTLGGFEELIRTGVLGEHAMTSIVVWFIGYALAVSTGIVVGLVVGSSVPADRLASPVLWTIYATPWLTYEPIAKVWFGFGSGPAIFLVFIASVFPVLLNTSAGIRTVNQSLIRAGRVFGATRRQLYLKILLPSTVPFTLAGMRQGAVMATIALIVAEMTGSSVGMGALIAFTANQYNTDQSFAVIVLVIAWSMVVSQLIKTGGKLLTPWSSGGGRG